MLAFCAENGDGLTKEKLIGVYHLGEYIHDQLDAVGGLLSLLHGVLPETFDKA